MIFHGSKFQMIIFTKHKKASKIDQSPWEYGILFGVCGPTYSPTCHKVLEVHIGILGFVFPSLDGLDWMTFPQKRLNGNDSIEAQ